MSSSHIVRYLGTYKSDIDGDLREAESIAYVDHLICIMATHKGIQQVANIVSEFCIMFRMTLNTSKFRAYSINWGNPSNSMSEMIIHVNRWSPIKVVMQNDGTMEHLGVSWDMSLDNEVMFRNVLQHVKTHIDYIINSKASLNIKICAISVSLMSSLVYETKFTTWPCAV